MSSPSRTGSCGHAMDPNDDHDLCFACLGIDHPMADCSTCMADNLAGFTKRSLRLSLWACFPAGTKPPGDHTATTYKRRLAKVRHQPPSPSGSDSGAKVESDREVSRDTPSHRPASGGTAGLVSRAAAVGARPLDPPGVQRSSGLGGVHRPVPVASMSVAPGAVLAPGGTLGTGERVSLPPTTVSGPESGFWANLGPACPGLAEFLQAEGSQVHLHPPSSGLPAQASQGGQVPSSLGGMVPLAQGHVPSSLGGTVPLAQGLGPTESLMDTSCLGAGVPITPIRGLGGSTLPIPAGQPIPDLGRVGQGTGHLPTGVCQEGMGPLGLGVSSTPRFRPPTPGGAMRFAGQGPLLRMGQQTHSQSRPWGPTPAMDQAGQLTSMFQAFLAQQGLVSGGPSGPTPSIPAPVPAPTPVVAQLPAPVHVASPVVPMSPAPTTPAHVAPAGEEGQLSYRRFLEATIPHLSMHGFIIEEGPSGDALDGIVGGRAPRQPPWGLALSSDRFAQLTAGLDKPAMGAAKGSASSLFKMPPQLYRDVFLPPAIDAHIAQQGPSHSKPVPQSQVSAWARQLAPQYEAHLSAYRLAYHMSIMCGLLYKFVPQDNVVSCMATSFLAAALKEQLASSLQATSHTVALWRSMVLGPLDYTSRAKSALIAMPYQGQTLFGSSLHTVLQREVDASKALLGEKILRESSAPRPKAARPPQVAATYSRPPTLPTPRPQYQGPTGKAQGGGHKRPKASKPTHKSKKAKGSGV